MAVENGAVFHRNANPVRLAALTNVYIAARS
jgi:hypothetical protein